MSNTRNRISSSAFSRALYLYYLGLSTRNVANTMFCLHKVKRSHVAIWKWIQKYHPRKILSKRKGFQNLSSTNIAGLKLNLNSFGYWYGAIEPENRQTQALSSSKKRNKFVAERRL